jgi:hypothetical protein
MNRDLEWNMNLAPETIRRLLSYIDDRDQRTLVEHFLERYLSEIVPAIPKLRTRVIHSDKIKFWTLYGHLSRDSLAGLSPGRAVIRGQEIGRIGHLRENGGWSDRLSRRLSPGGVCPRPASQRSLYRG